MTFAKNSAQPLANIRHEQFAQRLSRGASYGEAWKATVPFGTEYKGGANSLRVTGFRVAQRPEVAARIEFLRYEAKQSTERANEPLSQADVVRLNLEVSNALETAYKAADAANVPPQKLEALRRVLAGHLARQGKLDQPQAFDLKPTEATKIVEKVTKNMAKVCACPT